MARRQRQMCIRDRIITKQYSSSTDLETIQEEIILDESIEEMIPEVPNQ